MENLDIRAKTPPHQTDVVLTVLGMKRQCLQNKGKKNKQGQQCGCHVWCLVNLTVWGVLGLVRARLVLLERYAVFDGSRGGSWGRVPGLHLVESVV